MEELDGMDSEDYFFPFTHFKAFFSDYKLRFWSFPSSSPLLSLIYLHCEPEELELISADVPAPLGEGETTVCLC